MVAVLADFRIVAFVAGILADGGGNRQAAPEIQGPQDNCTI